MVIVVPVRTSAEELLFEEQRSLLEQPFLQGDTLDHLIVMVLVMVMVIK
jgi:hypothetical protein